MYRSQWLCRNLGLKAKLKAPKQVDQYGNLFRPYRDLGPKHFLLPAHLLNPYYFSRKNTQTK